jgi:hypothetical protein
MQHKNKHRKKVASLLKKKQRRLANLINLTLSNQGDEVKYYQGYHDVACIFLHALGNDGGDKDPLGVELPARVLGQVTQFQLRDSCRSSFASFQQCLQWTLFPLLAKLDPQLHNHLKDCDMEPFFCLSWILTWFAHDVRDTNLVKRLFDAFLVSHPLLVLYVTIAMMTHPINRKILLDTDCDFADLHHTLSMLPRNSSRAGWKKGRQGGYVSDDVNEKDAENESDDDNDEDDDDDNQSTNTGMDSRWDHSVASSSEQNHHKSMSLATSATTGLTLTPMSSVNHMPHSALVVGDKQGTSQRNDKELVPFQLLIETALGFMKHYPPSGLMEVARRYYQHQNITNVSPTSTNIRMLQPPPSWAIASTATADWVYKQRARQEMGRTKTSRKDRRRNRKLTIQQEQEQQALVVAVSANTQHQLSDEEFLQLHRLTMAVIAAGYGPFGAKEETMYLRRKRMMMRGALVVGVTTVMLGVAYHYFYNSDNLVGNTKMQYDNPQIDALTDESGKSITDGSRTEESLIEKKVDESGSQAAVAYLVGDTKMKDDNPQIDTLTNESYKATTDTIRTEESLLKKRGDESASQGAVAYLVGDTKMKDDNPQADTLTDESFKATTDASRTEESLFVKRVHEIGSQVAVAQKKEPRAEALVVTRNAASGLSTTASAAVQRDDASQISAIPVAPSSSTFMTTASSKASLESTRPVLPPSITPATLFPSPSGTGPIATTQPETPKKTRGVFVKLDQQLKKFRLALYHWTSKLILWPIQLVIHFWQHQPPSPPPSNNLH